MSDSGVENFLVNLGRPLQANNNEPMQRAPLQSPPQQLGQPRPEALRVQPLSPPQQLAQNRPAPRRVAAPRPRPRSLSVSPSTSEHDWRPVHVRKRRQLSGDIEVGRLPRKVRLGPGARTNPHMDIDCNSLFRDIERCHSVPNFSNCRASLGADGNIYAPRKKVVARGGSTRAAKAGKAARARSPRTKAALTKAADCDCGVVHTCACPCHCLYTVVDSQIFKLFDLPDRKVDGKTMLAVPCGNDKPEDKPGARVRRPKSKQPAVPRI